MRIVQLITHMNEIGGAQIHVRDISKRLVHDGHLVTVISGGDEKIADELSIEAITYMHSKYLIRNISMIKDLFSILDIRKKLKILKPDIVAIHSSKAGIIGRIACWSLRIPFVFTAHGWAFTEGVGKKKQLIYRNIEKVIGKLSKKVITVCDQDRNLALRYQVLPSEKMETVHNGVLDTKNTLLSRENREVVNISMIARFEKPKQQLDLLKALLFVKELNWHMTFVGDGSFKKICIKFVQENHLDHKVTFLGSNSNVSDILRDSDLFVLTSAWEGLPLSVLEAMVHGLPIIASNVGGVKEAVIDSENGFLIRNNLSELLSILLENELLRTRMGEKSREIYEASFTFEKMYQKTISAYHNLIISGENV